jgi:hypothetical protein
LAHIDKAGEKRMKKLLNEWRQFLKEVELSDVEASVERDADLPKHADTKMEIENALEDADQDWVIQQDDWPAAPGRSPEEFQEAMTQMEAALQNYLGVSIKGLLAGELLPKKNESVEKEISKTLSDEGGAAGFDPLHKAAKKVEKDISKKEVEDTIKDMDNVTKHRDGDYIKEESEYEAAMRRLKDKAEAGSVSIEVDPEEEDDIDLDPYDDEDVAESRSSYNRDTIRKMVEEEMSRLNEKPAKGKAKQKVTASGKKVSYGQAGKAKGGGPRVRKGTSKGDSYCARSLGIKKGLSKKKQNDPNTPNNLSRKRWGCDGAKSNK